MGFFGVKLDIRLYKVSYLSQYGMIRQACSPVWHTFSNSIKAPDLSKQVYIWFSVRVINHHCVSYLWEVSGTPIFSIPWEPCDSPEGVFTRFTWKQRFSLSKNGFIVIIELRVIFSCVSLPHIFVLPLPGINMKFHFLPNLCNSFFLYMHFFSSPSLNLINNLEVCLSYFIFFSWCAQNIT